MRSRRNLVREFLGALGGAALLPRTLRAGSRDSAGDATGKASMTLYSIGEVQRHETRTRLCIAPEYQAALQGLEGFSHAWVLYWFDRNDTAPKRRVLRVHPRGNRSNPLTGVFACRSPVRPNLIALALCRIQAVEAGVVTVDKIDAFSGSPILDIKPYIPAIDRPGQASLQPDWLQS